MSDPGPPAHTVGLLLGAGAATRFGSPKQTARLRGVPLILWSLRALQSSRLDQVIVVLGAHADSVLEHLDSDVETVTAPDWPEGLSASLRAGVRAAHAIGATQVVVALADGPHLDPRAVDRVLSADPRHPVVRASYAGQPGHPTRLSAATFAAVAALRGDAGARRLPGVSPQNIPCDDLAPPGDVDRPEDLHRLQSSGYISQAGPASGASSARI